MKRKALIVSLSAQAENVVVTDNLSGIEGKTKKLILEYPFLTIRATPRDVASFFLNQTVY